MKYYLCAKIQTVRYIQLLKAFIFTGILLIVFILATTSCRKDEIVTDPSYSLSFSTDTIIFDTVFSTVGSTTGILKVYNNNDGRINISKIYLAGGQQSQYKINIDGNPVSSIENVELEANDSLYIFVKVTVDPTNQNSPMIVTDSVIFETNGNIQDVDLVAWGQDAHYYVGYLHNPESSLKYIIIAGENESVTWEDDKPYVLYGWGVVDSLGALTIGPGVDIHFHQNSGLWVYSGGAIQVNGLKDSLVVFQGDRLEQEYDDLPGQWNGIVINESDVVNEFNYAVVKNAFVGLQASPQNETTWANTLVLKNVIVENMTLFGLYSYAYQVVAVNSIFSNCATYTVCLVGGIYDFRQCTMADYWSESVRINPSVRVGNQISFTTPDGVITYVSPLVNAYFGNCIIYGALSEELETDGVEDTGYDYNFKYDNCLIRTELDVSDPEKYLNCLTNKNPLFVDYYTNDYHLDTLSPAIDAGNIEVVETSPIDILNDYGGNSRVSDDGPDLGAYEFIPE